MTPEEQLKVLRRIWVGNKEGYVFLPWIPAAQARTKARKKSWQEAKAFRWPQQEQDILEHLREHRDDELYFAPMMFSEPFRREEYAIVGNRLWADLDEVDPNGIEEHLKPTIAWRTSPDRYAAVWCMNKERQNVTGAGRENQKLTHYLGADPSGWDTTQLLRVPGSANNKAEYPKGTRGELLWKGRGRVSYNWIDELPDVKNQVIEVNIDEQLLEGVDRHDVWGRVRLKVSKRVRTYMGMRDTEDFDRSEVAWQIERDLADAGCSLPEIVALMRPSIWNKFEGRQDELKRLMTEASKAISARDDEGSVLEDDDNAPKPTLVPFWEKEEYINVPEPEWLVPGLIPTGGCGFIAGIPKSMKSWFALDLAISLTTGEEWLGTAPVEPTNVLYIQEEDPVALVRYRHGIIAASKDEQWKLSDDISEVKPYPANLFVEIYQNFNGTDEGWQAWLADVVAEHQIGMIIMDTLATIAPGVDIDSGREVKSELLDPIKDIARATGAAVLIVHHMTKAMGSERAGQNMAGSGQIHAWADYGLYVINKDEKTHTVKFAHETKYTGSVVREFRIEGITEEQWHPVEVITDHTIQPTQGERETTKRERARIREAVPNIAATDPLGQEQDLSSTTRLRRAYIKQQFDECMKSGYVISVKGLAQELSISEAALNKYIQFLRTDYPHLLGVTVGP